MKKSMHAFIAVSLALCSASLAHLKAGSLTPAGGETFHVGDSVKIKWTQSIGHTGIYDIYFSTNGTTFTEFATRWQGPTGDNVQVTYPWKFGTTATTTAKIRVCQLFGGECTDPVYTLVSNAFTLTTATNVVGSDASIATDLRFDPASRHVDLAFTAKDGERVTLDVFDAQGKALANLLDGTQSAGNHQLSLFSNRLQNASGTLVFRLRVGTALTSQTVNVR